MRILIAAGGTGGHIYPALAVVTQLRTRLPELELRWLGGRRGLEHDIVPAADVSLDRLWLRSLRTVDASLNTILDPLRLTLHAHDFLGGESPLYADYLVFGSLQWARAISPFRLLEEDDPVRDWFERCLDLFDGLGRNAPGYD